MKWDHERGYTFPSEIYEFKKHFDMINSWGQPLDPKELGTGLVIPDLCCCFLDGIGQTNAVFVYGWRCNLKRSTFERIEGGVHVRNRLLDAATANGYKYGLTSTSNPVVKRSWCIDKASRWFVDGELLRGAL